MADSQQSLRYVDPRELTLSSASEPEPAELTLTSQGMMQVLLKSQADAHDNI
jgi:hypothetical protein